VNEKQTEEQKKMQRQMEKIKHKILVLSGKGGVGKSTVAVNLAVSLSLAGKQVGLLDVDIHGPSIPTMLGLVGPATATENGQILPLQIGNLKVISVGLFLENPDDALIWRGPMKIGVIRQFLSEVAWGELDYLVIDSPPGTGDEPLTVCQMIENPDGAILVTTPQQVSLADVRKSVTFCRQLNLPILGVVENMSGFVCPHCGEITEIFKTKGGQLMAGQMNLPFLGSIPIDPQLVKSCDEGRPFIHHFGESAAARAMETIIKPILDLSSNPTPASINP